jgi:hypothetical protein
MVQSTEAFAECNSYEQLKCNYEVKGVVANFMYDEVLQGTDTREIQIKNLKSAIKIQNTAHLSCKLTIMILMV